MLFPRSLYEVVATLVHELAQLTSLASTHARDIASQSPCESGMRR